MDRDKKIEILQDLVRIKSVNGKEEEVAKYLQKLLKEYDIDSDLIEYNDNRSNLVLEYGEDNGKVLGISGHMDVVEAGDESEWEYPPFDAEIEDGKLYGRGATDMKAGLAALIISLIELKESGEKINGKIKLLATVGEEVGELGAKQLTEEGYVDDLDALLIAEPSGPQIVHTHMGSINYTITSYGKESHSSMPEKGVNAINYLNEYITKIRPAMDKITEEHENEKLDRTIHNITVINGGNQVNSIPEKATLQGNIRSIPEYDNDKLIELLQKAVDEVNNEEEEAKLELTVDFNKNPVDFDTDSEIVRAIKKAIDSDLELVGLSATTDAAEFTKADTSFDLAIYGPGISNLAHQVNEYVEVEDYLDYINQFQDIYLEYFK